MADRWLPKVDIRYAIAETLKDPWRVVAIVVSGLSLFALLQRLVKFELNWISAGLIEAYSFAVRFPLIYLFDAVAVRLDPSLADILVAYSVIGGLSARTLFLVHDPTRITTQKGSWKYASKALLKIIPGGAAQRGVGRILYTAVSAYMWPLIMDTYFFRNRYIWITYFDVNDRPDVSYEVFRRTSPHNVAQIEFPGMLDYTGTTRANDGGLYWHVLSGDFRVVFGASFVLLAVAIGALFIVNAI